jgi:hypothetical protein
MRILGPTSTLATPRIRSRFVVLWEGLTLVHVSPGLTELSSVWLMLSPGNVELDRQNSDKLAPPGTDHGQVELLILPIVHF